MFSSNRGVFGVGLPNDAIQILPRPTPVAMATKFGTKSAITRLVQEISLRGCRISGVIEVRLSNDVNQILKRPTLVATATKFETKQAITPLV